MADDDFIDRLIRLGLPIAVGAGAIGWLILADHKPQSAPAVFEAYGCYTAEDGQRVVIDEAGFHPMRPAMGTIAFDLVRTNSGLRLELERAPLALIRSKRTKSLFAEQHMSLAVQTDLDTAAVVDGFWLVEAEGRDTLYRRAPTGVCS